MNYHLAIEGGTQGPFSEQQVRAMLASGTVNGQTLAWREGEKDWQPLSTFGLHAAAPLSSPTPPALPPPRQSTLGMGAPIFRNPGVVGWLLLFTVAGVVGVRGYADDSFKMFLGLFIFAGLFGNLLMTVLGLVAFAGASRRTVPLVAVLLNGLELVGVIGVMAFGLMMKS